MNNEASETDIELSNPEDNEIGNDIQVSDDEACPGKVYAECMTDMTLKNIEHLENTAEDYISLQADYCHLKKYVNFANLTLENFIDDEQIKFYTGLGSAKLLRKVFNLVAPSDKHTYNNKLSEFQEFILFLVRIRLNLLTQDLGYRFNVSQETVSRIFSKWLNIMYMRFKKVVFWPERENLIKTMPLCFKEAFDGHVAVIIDCFEITICRPSSLDARAKTWSNYKQRNTAKFLIGIAPQGMISYVSLGWGGRATDKFITEECGILNNLLPGDSILADRGFNNLNSVGFYCVKLHLPASARGKKQLNPIEVETTRNIAALRIHVERVTGLLKNKYTILKGTLPIEMCFAADKDTTQIDKIVHVCAALVNLMKSIVPAM